MSKFRRFSDISVSEKLVNSLFLLTMGVAYLFALGHMLFSHQDRDQQPGLSVDDIRIAYYGSHQQTRLGAALNGSMASQLPSEDKKQTIFQWINNGATQDEFNVEVKPILTAHCTSCHSADSGLNVPLLTSYDEVLKLTETDTGASIQSLVRVSHIHLFGIGFILFLVGRIFILSEIAPTAKRIIVCIPFLAMLIDILAWFLTKLSPNFAYLVIIAGAFMGLSFATQILISLYDMWFRGKNNRQTK